MHLASHTRYYVDEFCARAELVHRKTDSGRSCAQNQLNFALIRIHIHTLISCFELPFCLHSIWTDFGVSELPREKITFAKKKSFDGI